MNVDVGSLVMVLRKTHVNRGRISPFQAAALERLIEHGFVTDADSRDRDAQTFEIGVALELATLNEFLADQQRREPVARTVVHLIRHDLEADAAFDSVVQPHRDRASAGVEVAGPQGSHHLGSGIERHQLEREPFGAEIAFGIGDEERRIAAGADDADSHGLGPRGIGNNPCGQGQRHARE